MQWVDILSIQLYRKQKVVRGLICFPMQAIVVAIMFYFYVYFYVYFLSLLSTRFCLRLLFFLKRMRPHRLADGLLSLQFCYDFCYNAQAKAGNCPVSLELYTIHTHVSAPQGRVTVDNDRHYGGIFSLTPTGSGSEMDGGKFTPPARTRSRACMQAGRQQRPCFRV